MPDQEIIDRVIRECDASFSSRDVTGYDRIVTMLKQVENPTEATKKAASLANAGPMLASPRFAYPHIKSILESWRPRANLQWEILNPEFAFRADAPLFGSIRVERHSENKGWSINWSVPGYSDTLINGEWANADAAKKAAEEHVAAAFVRQVH